MKKLFYYIVLILGFHASAQNHDPVSWSTSVEKIDENEYYLIMTADIEPGWHLYSQNVPEGGPVPSTFEFKNDADGFKLIDGTKEGKGHVVNDKIFNMKIKYFSDKAVFRQRIKITSSIEKISGSVKYMVCNDVSCLPPKSKDLNFEI